MLSRYLDGEATRSERLTLDAHLRDCEECQRLLASLTSTLQALQSMRVRTRPGLADSVIAALRSRSPAPDPPPQIPARRSLSPSLTVVPNLDQDGIEPPTTRGRLSSERRRMLRALIGYCLRRPQLRLTLPLGLSVGIALTLINKGYMIFNGRVDAEMCAVCALDFVIPFIALNVGLLVATRVTRRRRL
jgi:hypothetical protein